MTRSSPLAWKRRDYSKSVARQAGAARTPRRIEVAFAGAGLGRGGAGGDEQDQDRRMPATAHAKPGFYTPGPPPPEGDFVSAQAMVREPTRGCLPRGTPDAA